ncbi:hypothetical protein STAS_18259 [Striga asiatica]|uniref:U5 small nuclear ribonucleoprotein TSSC4 n=1 Tax=Striga asiatica TaxID=4170 RepID=A0A5A7Q8G5_STRAF|nr:hypothetical protein STAS_18259 [Striga asiatica]
MEDSFRVRADKVFGTLGCRNTLSSLGESSSLWCLGDEEIERREWKRSKDYAGKDEDGGAEYCPPVVQKTLGLDIQDLSDYEEVEEEETEDDGEIDGGKKKRPRNNITGAEASHDDYFDVQLNIGRDCTLDYEEEEDQYDKLAVGMEQAGDRLYMRDVKFADYKTHELSEYSVIPGLFQAVVKDPRANHEAAKMRLNEDAEDASKFSTSQPSNSLAPTIEEFGDPKQQSESESGCDNHDYNNNPKSILKRRENPDDSRSDKRVRFAFDVKSSIQAPEDQQTSEHFEAKDYPQASNPSMCVPDYLRNPSKYTRYSFDSSDDMDDQSNQKAYSDLFDILRRRNVGPQMDNMLVETPKTVVFAPRRKKGEKGSGGTRIESQNSMGDDNVRSKSWSVGVTAENDQESEVCDMEEDEPCKAAEKGGGFGRPCRQYRARASVDIDDDLN